LSAHLTVGGQLVGVSNALIAQSTNNGLGYLAVMGQLGGVLHTLLLQSTHLLTLVDISGLNQLVWQLGTVDWMFLAESINPNVVGIACLDH